MRSAPLMLLLAVAITMAMTSCVKNYTCHCDITYSGYPGLPDSTNQEYSIKDTKSNAKSKCSKESGNYTNTTYNNNGITTVEKCYIY